MSDNRGRGAVVWTALYSVAYIGSAAALASSVFPSGYTPWYPPAGLTLAFLIVAGPRPVTIAIVLAVRLLNTAIVFPDAWRSEPDGVVARAIAITGCYALAAWALRRVRLHHARLRELGWFAVIGVVGAPLCAALSVAVIEVAMLGGDSDGAFDSALTFWVGDAVAIAAIVPAVLLVAASRGGFVTSPRLPSSRTARVETLVQAAALILVPVIAIAISKRHEESAYLVLAVVPVIWVALRRSLVIAAIGLLVVTATLSIAAAYSFERDLALVEVQTVLLAAALAGLYIAAAVHTQEMAMADLMESEERYRSVVASAPDLVARFDCDGALRFASDPPWLTAAGGADAVLGDLLARWGSATAGLCAGDDVRSVEWEHHGDAGARVYSARLAPEHRADGQLDGVIAVVTDMTPQRRAEADRDTALRHDPLTGLINRTALLDLLSTLDPVTVAERLAILVIDIDHFKTVNGVVGHDKGSLILRHVSNRIVAAAIPEGLAAARVGGDEFAVAFLANNDGAAAGDVARRLLLDLRASIRLDDKDHLLTASIGVAVGCTPGSSPEDVFCDAEAAMHAAKAAGRNRVVQFDADRRSVASGRRTAETLLRARLAEGAVVVHYQPVFDLRTGAIVAVEALVRLRGRNDEIVMPERFIGLAEDNGLDVDLGTLVLEQVLPQLAAWPSATLVAHVNVTARQLTGPGFAKQVLDACARTGVEPRRLCLELTETLVMNDIEAAVVALTELRANEVGAALDDFGVGYSSIASLSRLPFTCLKIDRTFIEGLPDDPRSRALAGLVAGLGEALHLAVVAEGIETEEQAACLIELGCELGQGYLLARPAPAEDITRMLDDMRVVTPATRRYVTSTSIREPERATVGP